MVIKTKLSYKGWVFYIFVEKHIWIFPYWSLIYKTENREHALTTIKNLDLISRSR